ncbi:Cytochrome P450 3A4 [Balamuthia mandrillaris]
MQRLRPLRCVPAPRVSLAGAGRSLRQASFPGWRCPVSSASSSSSASSVMCLHSSKGTRRNFRTSLPAHDTTQTPSAAAADMSDPGAMAAAMAAASQRAPPLDPALLALPGPSQDVLSMIMVHRDGVGGTADILWDLRQKHGDTLRVVLGGMPSVAVFNPDHVAQVFRAEGKYPSSLAFDVWKKAQQEEMKEWLKGNLFFEEGDEWKRLRNELQKRMLPPLEAQRFIPMFAPLMRDASAVIAKTLAEDIPQAERPTLRQFLSRVTIESIAMALYGKRLGSLDPNGAIPEKTQYFIQNTHHLFDLTVELEMGAEQRWRMPGATREHCPPYGEMVDCMKNLWIIGTEYLEETRQTLMEKLQRGELDEDQLAVSPYLLPYLMSRGENAVSLREITTNVSGLFLGGVDTTSVSMQWVCYWLAKNPEVQDKLAEELRRELKGGDLDDPEQLRRLPYLKNVFKESTRISPATMGTVRTLEEDIQLGEHVIPKKTRIMLLMNLLGRDANMYPEPERFEPDRWLKKEEHPFALLPFSFGARMCLGARLAINETYVFLARVIQDWNLRLRDPSLESRPVVKLLTRPEPVPDIVFTPRRH